MVLKVAPGPPPAGEGPLWSADEGALYWVDIHRPAVHRLHVATGAHAAAGLPAWVGCLGLRSPPARTSKRKVGEGELVAALDGGLALLRLPTEGKASGSFAVHPRRTPGRTCLALMQHISRIGGVLEHRLSGHVYMEW